MCFKRQKSEKEDVFLAVNDTFIVLMRVYEQQSVHDQNRGRLVDELLQVCYTLEKECEKRSLAGV